MSKTITNADRVAELEAETTKLKLDLLTAYGEAEELSGKVAELEKALKVAKAGIEWALSNINCEPFEWSDEENADAHREAIETLAKINEVIGE